MWWVVCVVSLVTVGAGAQFYSHYSYEGPNLDNDYEDEAPLLSRRPDAVTRVRRFGSGDLRMLNPQEIYDVKGAIKRLLSGRMVDITPTRRSSKQSTNRSKNEKQHTGARLMPTRSRPTRAPIMEDDWFRERAILREDTTTTTTSDEITATTMTPTRSSLTTAPEEPTTPTTATHAETTPPPTTNEVTTDLLPTTTPTTSIETTTLAKTLTTESDAPGETHATESTHTTETDLPGKTHTTESETTAKSLTADEDAATKTLNESTHASTKTPHTYSKTTVAGESTSRRLTTTTSMSTSETPEPETTETSGPKFDIEALLAIVANMTYDYDTNLTQQLNETLQRFSIPTCEIPTTTTTVSTTETTTEVWYNTTIVSKCFVCGMDTHGIPRNTYCADAFATDFLPLVPIDPRAKGHISRFRKYCRYLDVNNYQRNRSDPRALLGRWTGGCAVRWVDLSGVYTQRTCRNRFRPTTGRHYGSKRMAKLELALANVDDGCVTSPMATLVPLSRGISLYARFHACVCTGNWCNRAVVEQQWTAWLWLLLVIMVEVVR
ncbi:flocculation protein FLO11 [Manduca sexta]|uniref:Uncharacterized protein n=1 Tax=Manduca sexta TaxID=7130 RepID=A0A922CMN5_MANSE|nr:flocculation protein FLO11 [Manduca sexta]KAG6451549.1 hypothetical protein O3G_MSEX007250 [Manduca sexta]